MHTAIFACFGFHLFRLHFHIHTFNLFVQITEQNSSVYLISFNCGVECDYTHDQY